MTNTSELVERLREESRVCALYSSAVVDARAELCWQAADEIECLQAALAALQPEGEVERLREALTPSAATKAAYIGEFSFERELWDEDGEQPYVERQAVPWSTIKEIMAAIRDRALRTPTDGEK